MTNHIDPLLTSKDVGEILGVCPKVCERMAQRRELPALKVGRFWRYPKLALDSWIASRVQSVAPTVSQGDSI
jgi:excisionase family DNA binding protein